MKKIKTILVALLACALCAVCLAGCMRVQETVYEREYEDGKIVLTVWTANPLISNYKSIREGSMYYEQAQYTKRVVDKFEAENPEYKVRLSSHGWGDALNMEVQRESLSNDLPDLLVGSVYTQKYIDLGVLSPMDISDFQDTIVEGALKPGIVDGEVYAVPVMTGTFALYYNETMLIEAGYTNADNTAKIPQTWEELVQASVQVQQHYNSPKKGGAIVCAAQNLANAFRALPIMTSYGGNFLNDAGELVLDSQANIEAYDIIRRLAQTSPQGTTAVTDQQQLVTSFFNGDAAFMIESSTYYATASETDLTRNGTIKVTSLPKASETSERTNVVVGNMLYSTIKYSPNKEAALAFIKTLLSPECQLDAFVSDGRIPVVNSVLSGLNTSEDADVKDIAGKLEPFYTALLEDDLYAMPCFINNSSTIWSAYNNFFSDVVSSSATLESITSSLKSTSNEIAGKL